MPRSPRKGSASGIHHVMNRGVDHQPVFRDDADRLDFGVQLAWMHENLEVSTVAYCLMGNHYHLILEDPGGQLSPAMKRLSGVFTQRANRRHDRDGPLFRGRFHSIPVESDAYLLWAVRYVHRSALDLPGVTVPGDHRWSSYNAYIGRRPVADFLDLSPVMDLLGGDPRRLVALTEDVSESGAVSSPLRLDGLVSIVDLISVVRFAVAVDDLQHGDGDVAPRRSERAVLVLLAHRSGDGRLGRMILRHLDLPSRRTHQTALRRAERRLAQDPALARVLDRVMAYLATRSGVATARV